MKIKENPIEEIEMALWDFVVNVFLSYKKTETSRERERI